jgi:hypothetical protein
MSLTLRSKATADLLLLNGLAKDLLGALGKDATQPGILVPQDMAAALRTLQDLPDAPPSASAEAAGDEAAAKPEPAFADEVVPLRRRAVPLIRMIERALSENHPIVWGV